MSDRELLELAAKAAGMTGCWIEYDQSKWLNPSGYYVLPHALWNPLNDDGDALRLAASLKMDVLQDSDSVNVKRYVGPDVDHQYLAYETIEGDRLKTTRLAIVRAAAEIGRITQ
jgi:hypothetical protein